MERDLLEKLLAAQVLTLAQSLRIYTESRGSHGGDRLPEAIRLIRDKQADIIQKLLAPPEPGAAGS